MSFPERNLDTPLRRMVDERGIASVRAELDEIAREVGERTVIVEVFGQRHVLAEDHPLACEARAIFGGGA